MTLNFSMLERPYLSNQLLRAMPKSDYQRLESDLVVLELVRGQVLYEPNEPVRFVYFPCNSVISLVNTMENGSTTEIGLVGAEGIVGLPALWNGVSTPSCAMAQIEGHVIRLDADLLIREFRQGGVLQQSLLQFMQALFTQVSQTAACNRHHTVEERLARWLLMVQDRVQSNEILLTQEFISIMLGTRRSGVTVAAGILQQAGMIRYTRGKITVLSRENLEAAACECYQLVRSEYSRLLSHLST